MASNNRIITVLLGSILVAITVISFVHEKDNGANGDRSICVEGAVDREVVADTADWTLRFERIGEDQQALERKNSEEKIVVSKLLIDQGISQDEMEMYNYVKEDYSRRFDDAVPTRYRVGYFVHVKTSKLHLVAVLKNNISKMLGGNYGLVENSLKTSCSNQEAINRELARLAAENAMERAKDLTRSLDLKLKKIITIETPTIWGQSGFPEADVMAVNGLRSAKMGAPIQAEDNASEAMTKRKIHASIRMKIAIK